MSELIAIVGLVGMGLSIVVNLVLMQCLKSEPGGED